MSKLSKSIEQRGIRVSLSVELTNDAYEHRSAEAVEMARAALDSRALPPTINPLTIRQPEIRLPSIENLIDEALKDTSNKVGEWLGGLFSTVILARYDFAAAKENELNEAKKRGEDFATVADEISQRATTAESELTAARADAESKARLLEDERATNARLAEELAAFKARDKTRAARQRRAGKKAGRK